MAIITITSTPSNSTLIKSFEYSYITKDDIHTSEFLKVEFVDGRILEYNKQGNLDLDMEQLHYDWTHAVSVGKFWHKNIKDKLQYKKIK